MLILSRRLHERIVITLPGGRDVVVTVVDLSHAPGKVRLGIDAPPEVTIVREELLPPPPRTTQTGAGS
jgi:carbon storage regulator CsrA